MSQTGTILIVEDDADVRGALTAFLEGAGYTVVEAEHGGEALDHLRTSAMFCLILLDLFMPVMNGWAFRTEQLRDPHLAPIPVIVISADADAANKAADLGVADHLGKPIDLERLLVMVGRHC